MIARALVALAATLALTACEQEKTVVVKPDAPVVVPAPETAIVTPAPDTAIVVEEKK